MLIAKALSIYNLFFSRFLFQNEHAATAALGDIFLSRRVRERIGMDGMPRTQSSLAPSM